MDWSEWVNSALLGTDRAELGPAMRRELATLMDAPLPEAEEETLLLGAAVVGLLRRSSRPLEQVEGGAVLHPPRDHRLAPSPAVARAWRQLTEGKYSPFLPEALRIHFHHQVAIPPEALPALFESSLARQDLFSTLADGIHPADAWLARQHPRWRILAPLPADGGSDAPLDLRLATLMALRKTRGAISQLSAQWPDMSPTERTVALQIFTAPLEAEELEFAAQCLSDSRKEVRQAAAEVLLAEPRSALSQSWTELVRQSFSLGKGRFTFEPDPGESKNWRRLGLWPKEPLERARLFATWTPPEKWETWYGLKLEELLLLSNSATGRAWRAGLTAATVSYRHSGMALRLIQWGKKTGLDQVYGERSARQLIELLGRKDFLKLVAAELAGFQGLIPEQSLARRLLAFAEHEWTAALSERVVGGLREWMTSAESVNWNVWHYRKLLSRAAYRIPQDTIPKMQRGWPEYGYIWNQWEREVEQFLRILDFRRHFLLTVTECSDAQN